MGETPNQIVGFRFDGGWTQIPIEVDERAIVDFGTIYDTTATGLTILTYTDTSTFTGPDPDPLFDADDELVLMGCDVGLRSTSAEPPGTVPGSGVELVVHDPLTGDSAYAYLFVTDGALEPGAGTQLVGYNFNLLSGGYKATYNTHNGPNPEDTDVTTSVYGVHFSDRWIRDETRVTEGGASGVDILDRHKSLFGPGNCARSEDTFSAGEGAFIFNRVGPVRALRGYVGCNSGPTTYRIHAFYEKREDILTDLRVHPIPGIMDYFDYSPDAAGMIFRDDLNTGGFTIDGSPDPVVPGQFSWEMVTGAQGTLGITLVISTNIQGFNYTSYYSDNLNPTVTQCTGDRYEYGASGFWEDDAIPNTDPGVGPYSFFRATRVIAYAAPGQGVGFAQACAAQVLHPLTATAHPYVPDGAAVPVSADGAARLDVRVLPNPAVGCAYVELMVPVAGPVRVEVYDVCGRKVGKTVQQSCAKGSHDIQIPIRDLPAGLYFLRAVGPGGSVATARLIHLPE